MIKADTMQVIADLQRLRRPPGAYTNISMLPAEMAELLKKSETQIFQGRNSLIVLEMADSFLRMHGCAIGAAGVSETREFLKKQRAPIVVDAVNKRDKADQLMKEWLMPSGFEKICTLIRMRKTIEKAEDADDLSDVVCANAADVQAIDDLLRETFNPYVSRLPSKEVLYSMAEKEGIYVLHKNGILAGLAIFRRLSSKSVLLEQLAVASAFRQQGHADLLLKTGFAHFCQPNDTIQLWCVSEHENVVRFYKNHSFVADGLINHIMLLKG